MSLFQIWSITILFLILSIKTLTPSIRDPPPRAGGSWQPANVQTPWAGGSLYAAFFASVMIKLSRLLHPNHLIMNKETCMVYMVSVRVILCKKYVTVQVNLIPFLVGFGVGLDFSDS